MNSLIIAVDASRARLFRTAATNIGEEPVELIEIGVVDAPEALGGRDGKGPDDVEARRFARDIADRVVRFAEHHFSNPVIVVAVRELSSAILAELEHRLSNASIHQIIGETARLPPPALLRELSKRQAFSSPQARTPGTIEL